MNRREALVPSPCDVAFAGMRPVDRGRLCAECQTVVHDLSSMTEAEARELMSQGCTERRCVRYLYDAAGCVVHAGERVAPGTRIIPEHRLTGRLRTRVASAALLATPLVLFEACGSTLGTLRDAEVDASEDGREIADVRVVDAALDAGTD